MTSMCSNRQRQSSASPNRCPDSLRLLSADAAHAHQLFYIRSHDTFNRPEFEQQAMCQRRSHSRVIQCTFRAEAPLDRFVARH
jgi:hypothetical protein